MLFNLVMFLGCELTQGVFKTDADGIKISDGKCFAYHSGASDLGVKVSTSFIFKSKYLAKIETC